MKRRAGDKLGQILLSAGLVSEKDLARALEVQAKDNRRLGETLVALGVLSPQALLSALARHLGVKAVHLRHGLIDPAVARRIDKEEALRLKVLPLFQVGDQLTVAMAEPQSLPAIDRLAQLSGCRINPVMALEPNLAEFQQKYLGEQVDVDSFLVGLTESSVEVIERENVDDASRCEISRMIEGSPIVNLVNLAVLTAIRDGASDLHIEPTKRSTRIRYRIDGQLRDLMAAPPGMHAAIVSRVKVIGKMNIAERRLPQEGRVHVVAEGREIDLRVSSMPSLLGEKIVLRILDKQNVRISLDELGLEGPRLEAARRIFTRAHGLVLVTGPTGSGKTTTLYSVLDLLNAPEKNLITIEDPVEYQLDGITQIQVNESISLDFARALRSILRQDPDVVMVGEIRDQETARVAIQAALTGHLVLSTLHTNNAPGAFVRLQDMGIERYLLASAVNGVIAQRLARKICPHCRTSYYPPDAALADAGWLGQKRRVYYKGEGCTQCHDSGFRGRVGIFEVLEVNDELRQTLHSFTDEEELRRVGRRNGWRPLREEGLTLVERGISTLEEVLRVTHAEAEDRTRAERRLATAASLAEPHEPSRVASPSNRPRGSRNASNATQNLRESDPSAAVAGPPREVRATKPGGVA